MKFTGERCILGKSGDVLEAQHSARYKFAMPYVSNKKILDIACGSGYGTYLIASKASEVVGVDISQEAIDYARKHYQKENIKFYKGDAANINFLKDEDFDVIVSFETIEHIPDYHQYLKEIYRLLKKGGIYLVSTPNKKYSSPNSEKPLNPYHVIEFYMDDFVSVLKKYFESVELYGQDLQEIKIRKYLRKLIPKRIRQKIIPAKIKEKYNLLYAQEFTNRNVENCVYFIAICRK